ncbi:MAG TPA: hypothetical protein VL171_15830 [Verrucomicrobiae bacterium]|nr:hypothetical protein [Verrucomicrobiae bacterium]
MSLVRHLHRHWQWALLCTVRCGLVVAVCLSIGGHWALLQSVAWTSMFVRFSSDGSFSEALSKTFDGQHPCCLCKLIQKGRGLEKKQERREPNPRPKQELGLIWELLDLHFACEHERVEFLDANAVTRRDAPPKPRPRILSFRFV